MSHAKSYLPPYTCNPNKYATPLLYAQEIGLKENYWGGGGGAQSFGATDYKSSACCAWYIPKMVHGYKIGDVQVLGGTVGAPASGILFEGALIYGRALTYGEIW